MAVFKNVLRNINAFLNIAADSVMDAQKQEIALLLLENLWHTLLYAASDYRANETHPNRLIILLSDSNIT